MRTRRIRVFYDAFDEAGLWGKDLYAHLTEVYQKKARFCVIFASKEYAGKAWTTAERRAAQARAMGDHGQEYILPVRMDDTEIPGLLPTISYVDGRTRSPEYVADLICSKVQPEPKTQPQGANDVCPSGPHTITWVKDLVLRLNIQPGARLVGTVRETMGREDSYFVLDEKNLVRYENEEDCLPLGGDLEMASHYVDCMLSGDGPFFLVIWPDGNRRGMREVVIDLRGQAPKGPTRINLRIG